MLAEKMPRTRLKDDRDSTYQGTEREKGRFPGTQFRPFLLTRSETRQSDKIGRGHGGLLRIVLLGRADARRSL